jgi:hypothetical protein
MAGQAPGPARVHEHQPLAHNAGDRRAFRVVLLMTLWSRPGSVLKTWSFGAHYRGWTR